MLQSNTAYLILLTSSAHRGTRSQEMIFSRNNLHPGKVTAMFSVYHDRSYVIRYRLQHMCSVNVSTYYFHKRGERLFVGLAGAQLLLRETSQSSEIC